MEEISKYLHLYSEVKKEERAAKGVSVVKKKFKNNITNLEYQRPNNQNIYEHLELQNSRGRSTCRK